MSTRSLAMPLALAIGSCCALSATAVTSSITLPGDKVFPENIAAARDGAIYVGSLGSGGVFRVKPNGTTAEVWIKPAAGGSRSIFGVLADDKSHTLWACSNDLSGLGVVIPSDETGSYLKGFDLATGALKVSVKLPGEKVLCNDITVGPDGAAYVSNTYGTQVFRLAPGGKTLEVWADDPLLAPPAGGGAGLDGLAFGADGNLYIDTYNPGELFRIDVKAGKSGKVTKLRPSRPLVLADAIRSIGGNKFLIIEGGGRLDRITVNGDDVTVDTLKDGWDVPTGVAVVGKTAWVSEGQLGGIFDPKMKGQALKPFKIDAVELAAH
jgi:sugar lactone lactonase YvrE